MRACTACLSTSRIQSSWTGSASACSRLPAVRIQALAQARTPSAGRQSTASTQTNALRGHSATTAAPTQGWRPEHSPSVRVSAAKRPKRDEQWHKVSAEENEVHNSFYLPYTAWDATAVVVNGAAGSTGSDGTGWSSRTGM